jgi:hypothetical protein
MRSVVDVAGAVAQTVSENGDLEIQIQVTVRDKQGMADMVVGDILMAVDAIIASEDSPFVDIAGVL